MSWSTGFRLAALALVFVLAGCGSSLAGRDLDVPNLHDAAGMSTCSAAKDPLHPLVVEWPTETRAELEAVAAKGPVVVSYSGCELRVLRACHVKNPASYELVSTTPAEQRLELKSSADLYAKLPLSVATLEGRLVEAGGFSLTYVAVGERVLDASKSPTLLDGDCDGASHYVDAMVVGAFDLAAHADRHGGVDAKVGRANAGADADASKVQGGSAGDVALCKEKGLAAGASCQAVLSLALTPLRVVSRSPLAVIPALGELRGRNTLDVQLLELVDAARKLDGDSDAGPRAKANAWKALAQKESPFRATAEQRRDDWLRIAAAEEDRHAHIMLHCPQYLDDKKQLARLYALDDAVYARDEKVKRQHAFDSAYGAWTKELATCASRPMAVADGMTRIPGGTFTMGVDLEKGRYINYGDSKDASPAHRVAVADFELDTTEVTVAAYRECVRDGECAAAGTASGCTGGAKKGELPINCVSQTDARTFCEWADKRLPTEEEWEYAARPRAGGAWPWGESKYDSDVETHACFRTRGPCAVGSMPGQSPFGIEDMAGNVWEWTDSGYTPDYSSTQKTSEVVIRGGSFESPVPEMLHATYRGSMDPKRRVPWVGFRCART